MTSFRSTTVVRRSNGYQFWPVRAGGSEGGWGRAIPIVRGVASMLALRVSTLFNVVRNAAITAITKTVAKMANTVRWVIIGLPHLPIMQIGWIGSYREVNSSRALWALAGSVRERISELARSGGSSQLHRSGVADL